MWTGTGDPDPFGFPQAPTSLVATPQPKHGWTEPCSKSIQRGTESLFLPHKWNFCLVNYFEYTTFAFGNSNMKYVVVLLLVFLATFMQSRAQVNPVGVPYYYFRSFAVPASANIQDNLGLVTLRNINLNAPNAVNGIVTVAPITSPYAGLMRIEGSPGKRVRLTYMNFETLLEEGGTGGVVVANYRISGYGQDNQTASILLDVGEATITISDQGYYFLWLGTVLDISQAKPGNYVSEFMIEMEGVS
jgi:hypothetical protein